MHFMVLSPYIPACYIVEDESILDLSDVVFLFFRILIYFDSFLSNRHCKCLTELLAYGLTPRRDFTGRGDNRVIKVSLNAGELTRCAEW